MEEVEKLEKVDEMFLRQLFAAHSRTPIEFLYIESGKYPMRFTLMSRRLNYWWHIVNSKDDSLLYKFYRTQKLKPVKNDWVLKILEDKKYLEIQLEDCDLKKMSRNRFKKLVRKQINTAAIKYLQNLQAPCCDRGRCGRQHC